MVATGPLRSCLPPQTPPQTSPQTPPRPRVVRTSYPYNLGLPVSSGRDSDQVRYDKRRRTSDGGRGFVSIRTSTPQRATTTPWCGPGGWGGPEWTRRGGPGHRRRPRRAGGRPPTRATTCRADSQRPGTPASPQPQSRVTPAHPGPPARPDRPPSGPPAPRAPPRGLLVVVVVLPGPPVPPQPRVLDSRRRCRGPGAFRGNTAAGLSPAGPARVARALPVPAGGSTAGPGRRAGEAARPRGAGRPPPPAGPDPPLASRPDPGRLPWRGASEPRTPPPPRPPEPPPKPPPDPPGPLPRRRPQGLRGPRGTTPLKQRSKSHRTDNPPATTVK